MKLHKKNQKIGGWNLGAKKNEEKIEEDMSRNWVDASGEIDNGLQNPYDENDASKGCGSRN